MNIESWMHVVENVQTNPFAQALLIAFATLILEDPVTISSGLLVSEGHLSFMTAFLGLTIGIVCGDMGLYAIGRVCGHQAITRGWISEEKTEKAREFISGWNLFYAILAARFVPMTRLPTYMAAGVVKAPAWRFLGIAIGATALWSGLLLFATIQVGRQIGPLLGKYRLPLAVAFIFLLILLPYIIRRFKNFRTPKKGRKSFEKDSKVNSFEFWPPVIFYFPVAVYYLYLSIRFRSLTLPSCANPSIYSGGIIGESKAKTLNLLPDELREEWVPKFALVKGSQPAIRQRKARRAVKDLCLSYPLVAKPDQGQRGDGVQLIENVKELKQYAAKFPSEKAFMIQEYCSFPHEAGIFYIRKPGKKYGKIISITLKEFPGLSGDGKHTIGELIDLHPRFANLSKVFKSRLKNKLNEVPKQDEFVPLVFSGNHCQGSIFKDGRKNLTKALAKRTHQVCSSMPGFYFGRMDVRFSDEKELMKGRGFKIIEINGASSEATHIWDPEGSLINAYRVLFNQFRLAFEIGHINQKRGASPVSARQVIKDWYDYQKISKKYPMTK